MLVFAEGGKPENPEKNPRSREPTQTQPTYGVGSGNRTRATLVGGECSHHCAIPAPLVGKTSVFDIVFFVSESLLGIMRQKELKTFTVLTRKARIHVKILTYRKWPMICEALQSLAAS